MREQKRKVLRRDEEKNQTVTVLYGQVQVHAGDMWDRQARLAEKIAGNIAVATAKWTGKYTPKGGQEWDLMPPDEVAKRACDIAAALEREFKERNWITQIPMTNETLGIPEETDDDPKSD